MADWNKIRKEYIKGGVSYRQLAAKYDVTLKQIASRAGDEGWVQLREQARNKTATKTVEAVASQESRVGTGVYDAAMDLLQAFQRSLAAAGLEEAMPPETLKDYGSALRSIQMVLGAMPTQLDIDEQKARIEKLRRESMTDTDDDDTGVIVLPPVMEEGAADG